MITLSRTLEVPVAPAAVWETLWDVPALARCVPGCAEVHEVEPRQRYRATVRERVGPFSVSIPLDVRVEAAPDGSRVSVTATGRDGVLGSPVTVSVEAAVAPAGDGTRLTLDGRAEIGGKLAALGQGVIQRKARDVLDGFVTNLDQLVRRRADAPAV